MPMFNRSKRRFPTLKKRSVAAIPTLLAALSPTPIFAGGVYSPFNVDFPNGVAQPSRSGPVALVDRFDAPDAWPEIGNYRDALSVEINAEFDGARALVVSRKTTNPDDPEDADTAWNATSVRRPLPQGAPGGEFVVRVAAKSSKTALAGNDDATWKGCAVLWFDGDGEPCGETPFLFAAGVGDFFGSRAFSGRVPDAAASFAIRLGFDIPDLALGDWVAIRSVEFETPVDAAAPFRRSGEFISEIFPGAGSQVSWNADLPAGTAVRFQIATAPALPDGPQSADAPSSAQLSQLPQPPEIPGDFGEFVGPDGTAATFFDAPFAVDAPFSDTKRRSFRTPTVRARRRFAPLRSATASTTVSASAETTKRRKLASSASSPSRPATQTPPSKSNSTTRPRSVGRRSNSPSTKPKSPILPKPLKTSKALNLTQIPPRPTPPRRV